MLENVIVSLVKFDLDRNRVIVISNFARRFDTQGGNTFRYSNRTYRD